MRPDSARSRFLFAMHSEGTTCITVNSRSQELSLLHCAVRPLSLVMNPRARGSRVLLVALAALLRLGLYGAGGTFLTSFFHAVTTLRRSEGFPEKGRRRRFSRSFRPCFVVRRSYCSVRKNNFEIDPTEGPDLDPLILSYVFLCAHQREAGRRSPCHLH